MPFLSALVIFFFAACQNAAVRDQKTQKNIPKPGTIVASAEVPVTDDTLNHFTCSVKVVADSNVAGGVYDVEAEYGPNFATNQFTMPAGAADYTLNIRKEKSPYSFIIGFTLPHDTTFYDYFEVILSKSVTRMQYTKAYTF